MTYELAEKLFKAGFPGIKNTEENPTPGYTYPTLSELIEACGDGIGRIEVFDGKKCAVYMNPKYWNDIKRVGNGEVFFADFVYELPEAVANLWLKLNENASS